MEPSKLQHRVTRTRGNGSKLVNSAGYSGPSGSGESWFTPKGGLRLEPRACPERREGRGNAQGEKPCVFFGSRPSARAQEGQLKSAGKLARVSHPADFRLVCCSSVPTPVAECPPHTSTP